MKKLLLLLTMVLMTYTVQSQVFLEDTTTQVQLDTVELVGIRADKTTPVSQITVTSAEIQQMYYGQEMNYILEKTGHKLKLVQKPYDHNFVFKDQPKILIDDIYAAKIFIELMEDNIVNDNNEIYFFI